MTQLSEAVETEEKRPDHLETVRGLVEVIQWMGNDLSPVNAARESLHKQSEYELSEDGTMVVSKKDKKFLNSLARRGHFSPYTHTAVTFRIKMPIYVSAQWFKHQVGLSVNSVSRRYVDEAPEYEQGIPWRERPESSIKQGSGPEFGEREQDIFNSVYDAATASASDRYLFLIKNNVAPEQARKVLPVAHMTEFWQTGNLESFARIYHLRVDPHAQQETREYAVAIGEHMARLFPEAWAAKIRDFRGEEIAALKARIAELEAELEMSHAALWNSPYGEFGMTQQ